MTHDADHWETVSGWVWSCRTCHAFKGELTEDEAVDGLAEHVATPIPWWVPYLAKST